MQMLDFLTLQTTTTHATFISIIYTILLAFLLSTVIAITYDRTFRGLSYSRNFAQAMILSSIVASTVMQAIGDSLARGLGMMGALAIIRFRTVFKDPRDIIFMFATLAVGISCGVYGFGVAVVGTLGFCGAAILLYYSPFGQTRAYDGMLRFNIGAEAHGRTAVETTMREFCRRFMLITLRETTQGNRLEYSYHIKLKPKKLKDEFLVRMKGVEDVKDVSLLLQETTVEL
ncbi:MAG: DUF4956 domain-containing protein [Chitinispirillaceae bacterium]|nr:DUF4956 domain-containing protein [Chitinispirillaceae bacterium]